MYGSTIYHVVAKCWLPETNRPTDRVSITHFGTLKLMTPYRCRCARAMHQRTALSMDDGRGFIDFLTLIAPACAFHKPIPFATTIGAHEDEDY